MNPSPMELIEIHSQLLALSTDLADHNYLRAGWRSGYCLGMLQGRRDMIQKYGDLVAGRFVEVSDEEGLVCRVSQGSEVRLKKRIELEDKDLGSGWFRVERVDRLEKTVKLAFTVGDNGFNPDNDSEIYEDIPAELIMYVKGTGASNG